jgi:hypothetical protein
MMIAGMFDRLRFLHLPSWLIMVSLLLYTMQASLIQDEVEFRGKIRTAISPLITLLNDNSRSIRLATVSALAKLVDHGEFAFVYYACIANAG